MKAFLVALVGACLFVAACQGRKLTPPDGSQLDGGGGDQSGGDRAGDVSTYQVLIEIHNPTDRDLFVPCGEYPFLLERGGVDIPVQSASPHCPCYSCSDEACSYPTDCFFSLHVRPRDTLRYLWSGEAYELIPESGCFADQCWQQTLAGEGTFTLSVFFVDEVNVTPTEDDGVATTTFTLPGTKVVSVEIGP